MKVDKKNNLQSVGAEPTTSELHMHCTSSYANNCFFFFSGQSTIESPPSHTQTFPVGDSAAQLKLG